MSKTISKNNFRKRNDIQVIRGIAVILVLLCHIWSESLSFFKIGVDIFFVISGFVITKSLITNQLYLKDNIITFFKKRIFRIAPLALISTLIIWIIFEVISPETFSNLDVFASAFGLQNILLGIKGNTYNGIGANMNPYTPFWSLGVEEQFYFLYPLLVYFIWIFNRKYKFIKAKVYDNFINKLSLVLIILVTFSFLFYCFNFSLVDPWSYYNPLTRFWEIGIGCLSFLSTLSEEKFLNPIVEKSNPKLNLFLSITFLLIVLFKPFTIFYPLQKLLFLLTLFLYLANPPKFIKSKVSILKKIQGYSINFLSKTGDISFSIYIWHWPILLIFKIIFGINISFWFTTIYLITTYFVSILSRSIIEIKISKWITKKNKKNEIYLYFYTVMLLSFSILGPYLSNKVLNVFRPNLKNTTKSTFVSLVTPSTEETNCGWGFENSFSTIEDEQRLYNCLSDQIDKKNRSTIFLFGDSHSTAIAPGLFKYSQKNNMNFSRAAHVYCPYRNSFTMNWKIMADVSKFSCSKFNTAWTKYIINNSKEGDLVVISSRDLFYFSDKPPLSKEHYSDYLNKFITYKDQRNKDVTIKRLISQSIQDLNNLANNLISKNVHLVLILQPHENQLPLHYCDHILSDFSKNCVTKKENVNLRRIYANEIIRLSKENENINIFDMFNYSCQSENECRHLKDEKYIFRDDDHISNYAATEFFYGPLANLLSKIK